MPKRPRTHEIEDESFTALASRLPSAWVLRKQDKDYGIDAEVEIFDEGETTGLTFKVQLKGTDSTFKNRKPYVRIDRDTFEYWDNSTVPS